MASDLNNISLFDKTAKRLLEKQNFISSGCPIIDKILGGGFCKQGITQIYGQAGTGKSQIALQLCLSVQQIQNQDGYSYGAVYICTEAAFPVRRLQLMLSKSELCKKYSVSTDIIFVEHISSMEELDTYLRKKLCMLLKNSKIGVIIIDSIAAPFTAEYDENDLKTRANCLRNIGVQLHSFSRQYNLSVICINQVRADMNNAESEIPALGISWETAITNSIYLFKRNGKRFAQIMISPYLPRKIFEFEIYDAGVKGVKDY